MILAGIILIVAVGVQQVKSHNAIINLISPKVSVANSKIYKQNTILGTKNVSLGGGGYVTGIYLHPKERDLVYIKTDVGGFYRWNSASRSWIPLTEQFSLVQNNYYGGEALALDPNNPNIVYIAVGKYTSDWWQYKGTIFKSTDKGKTWTKLNLDLKMGGNDDIRWAGERLAVDPFNSQALFFGSRQDGLWKSLDGGKTWANVQSFPGKLKKGIGITAVVFSKYKSGTVYAVAYEDAIYKSTDTGKSWTKIANSPSKVNRIAIASSDILYVTHSSGVSQLKNGSWNNITPFNSKLAFNGITLNPNNFQEILVSTFVDKGTKIYHSSDGGRIWQEQKRKANNTVPWWNEDMISHGSVAAIEFDPHVASRVWLTDWYGIWQTENTNTKPVVWTNYQTGHEELVTFALVSPPSGALLLSGVADVDGFYHNQGLDNYPSKNFGARGPAFQDTYSIAYSEVNPKRMARVGGNRFNNTYSGATSDDGGLTWKQFGSFPQNTLPTRIAMSATDANLMIVTVSDRQPLRTTDGGNSWKQISGLPKGFSGPWNWLQPLVADTVDGMTFYYYDNSKLYRSTNGGASFDVVSSSIPHTNWHSLKASPGVKGELWLGMDEQGLFHSTNGGQTFSRLPMVKRAHLFALGKPQPGSKVPALYLYGEIDEMGQGIFRSLDRGKTWKRIGDRTKPIGNSPNVMEASKQEFGLVFIGTNGRGIYYGNR
uniref:BNR/Asp-box repeat-containing protein n=1 Tax=Tolypothrix bouteillei VB521301 TaxID=1479485 RepID=A0A0C1NFI3_9CYAN